MSGMDLKSIADALVAGCKEGREFEGLDKLYHEDAISIEAMAGPGAENREFKGIAAIKAKHEWWDSAMEVHSTSTDGPYLHGDDRFAVIFEMDTTEKASGNRMQMKEVAVYVVKDGKIVEERFFYTM